MSNFDHFLRQLQIKGRLGTAQSGTWCHLPVTYYSDNAGGDGVGDVMIINGGNIYNSDNGSYQLGINSDNIDSMPISSGNSWHLFFNPFDPTTINTGTFTDMSNLFADMSTLRSISLGGLDTSHVTDMSFMFENDHSLKSINLSGLDTSHVSNMSDMCTSDTGLQFVNLNGLNTSGLTDMNGMFGNDTSLQSVNLSGLSTGNVSSVMFYGDSALRSIEVSANMNLNKNDSDLLSDW